ncbi:enoyl-(Acyl carrier protein) reductase domain-containing protein [Ditylenchus destructor]|nr:enoyl-(Acyl carrier protein) reductase domain-containing protein [Ditylenchus destructor]
MRRCISLLKRSRAKSSPSRLVPKNSPILPYNGNNVISKHVMSSAGRFQGKVVIITGASSGIGQNAAIEFGKEGGAVVIHGQDADRLSKTESLMQQAGTPADKILKVIGSMELNGTPAKIVNETMNKFGKIDVLINNAGGVFLPGTTNPDSLENLDYLYKILFRSVVELTLLAVPHLEKTKGNVINIGGILGVRSAYPIMYYTCLKSALESFTKNCAHKYGTKGIRSNMLIPGPVRTNVVRRHGKTTAEGEALQKGFENWAFQTTALKRIGQCSEMSSVLKFLASDEASFVTGDIWLADGGWTSVTTHLEFLGA